MVLENINTNLRNGLFAVATIVAALGLETKPVEAATCSSIAESAKSYLRNNPGFKGYTLADVNAALAQCKASCSWPNLTRPGTQQANTDCRKK